MIDLNDPSPWLMTTFEKCGFFAGLLGVAFTLALDFLRKRSSRD